MNKKRKTVRSLHKLSFKIQDIKQKIKININNYVKLKIFIFTPMFLR